MERILLQEAQTNHTGNLKSQLLIIRKHIAADQFYDLHKTALLVQDRHDLVSVVHETLVHVGLVPGCQIVQVLTVTGQPLDSREMTGISQGFIQSPEAADETFGILGNGLGEIASLRGYGSDDGNASFCSV